MNKQLESCKRNGLTEAHGILDKVYLCKTKRPCEFRVDGLRFGGYPVCLAEKIKTGAKR